MYYCKVSLCGVYQVGFMLEKSTINQILIVKQVVEKSHEFDKDIYLLFVDSKTKNTSYRS